MQLLASHGYYAELAALYKHYSKHEQVGTPPLVASMYFNHYSSDGVKRLLQ